MRPRRRQAILVLFLLLSTGLAVNLLLLQKGKAGAGAASLKSERSGRLALEKSGETPPAATPARTGAAATPAPVVQNPVRTVALQPPGKPGQPSRTAPADLVPADDATTDPGASIRAVQRELLARGYELGPVDGQASLLTRAAVMAYEYDSGLPLAAEPSEALLKAMIFGGAGRPGAGGPKPRTAQAEQIVRTVQQMLSALNYNAGKVDGMLGEDTVRAIKEFESDQRLPQTGRISGALVGRLAKAASNGRIGGR